jgi:hypothetical protein
MREILLSDPACFLDAAPCKPIEGEGRSNTLTRSRTLQTHVRPADRAGWTDPAASGCRRSAARPASDRRARSGCGSAACRGVSIVQDARAGLSPRSRGAWQSPLSGNAALGFRLEVRASSRVGGMVMSSGVGSTVGLPPVARSASQVAAAPSAEAARTRLSGCSRIVTPRSLAARSRVLLRTVERARSGRTRLRGGARVGGARVGGGLGATGTGACPSTTSGHIYSTGDVLRAMIGMRACSRPRPTRALQPACG